MSLFVTYAFNSLPQLLDLVLVPHLCRGSSVSLSLNKQHFIIVNSEVVWDYFIASIFIWCPHESQLYAYWDRPRSSAAQRCPTPAFLAWFHLLNGFMPKHCHSRATSWQLGNFPGSHHASHPLTFSLTQQFMQLLACVPCSRALCSVIFWPVKQLSPCTELI